MSNPEPETPRATRRPLGVVRGIFAAIGIIIMVLTGGCAPSIMFSGPINSRATSTMVGSIAGIPFLIGLGIFLLATRAGR